MALKPAPKLPTSTQTGSTDACISHHITCRHISFVTSSGSATATAPADSHRHQYTLLPFTPCIVQYRLQWDDYYHLNSRELLQPIWTSRTLVDPIPTGSSINLRSFPSLDLRLSGRLAARGFKPPLQFCVPLHKQSRHGGQEGARGAKPGSIYVGNHTLRGDLAPDVPQNRNSILSDTCNQTVNTSLPNCRLDHVREVHVTISVLSLSGMTTCPGNPAFADVHFIHHARVAKALDR
ncbi:hypothetical protein ASPTUDRAFT_927172 [Aspergillus tubingensis CBS 134.48]|uniref:Uncharacterized protein n=1 Tax=Aspergillus tubingensis (strain CBS 134.48) TaxID=767770 RepID=A0A1L9N8Z8_ASPTC|nr:hypothetical protein ASPTUDRAFT_927172 [Aspergillus tubingensis CBS 134.48]